MIFKAITRKDVIYKNNTSPLCIQFLHDGRKRTIGLGISIVHEYWNAEAQKITDDYPERDNIQFSDNSQNQGIQQENPAIRSTKTAGTLPQGRRKGLHLF